MALTVDTSVPYGNAAEVTVAQDRNVAEVSFTADPHGGPERLWFCFRLRDDKPGAGRKIRLVLKHFYELLGGSDPQKLRPVVRGPRGDWARLEAGLTEKSADGQFQGVWNVELSGEYLDVALCYPYGTPEMEALVRETGGYWKADTIGVSQKARPIVRLSNTYGTVGGKLPGFFFLARQHSGETPGSWVLDGLLRRLATAGGNRVVVWAVPLTNIDGVVQGDYGKDNFPYDLNRAWGQPPMRHEVLVMQHDVRRWTERCAPVLAIDFHAPGACETEGMYTYLPHEDERAAVRQKTIDWATILGAALAATCGAPDFGRRVGYKSRWNTPMFGTYASESLGIPTLAIETPYSMARDTLFTREAYRDAGGRIAETLLGRVG